jgi:hypothetical protein
LLSRCQGRAKISNGQIFDLFDLAVMFNIIITNKDKQQLRLHMELAAKYCFEGKKEVVAELCEEVL